MSDLLHSGLHPDADSLNAFLEGALPEHERAQCLAHLAECSQCREVVFLAQEIAPAAAPVPAPVPVPVPFWRRWLAPVPALATAAALGVAVVAWLAWQPGPEPPAPGTVARNTGVPATPAPAPSVEPEADPRRPVPPAKRRTRVTPTPSAQVIPEPAPPAPPISAPTIPAPAPVVEPPPTIREELAVSPTGIAGIVADPTGAVIPGATIKVAQLDGGALLEAQSDTAGQFRFVDLAPGRYRLVIEAPGFRVASSEVDVQPRQLASVHSKLEVGSVAETVEVTASVPVLQTQVSSVRSQAPRPLPSKLPAADTVANGKLLLALDSAGAVFISRNSGRSWKRVKPVWPGKVRSIALGEPPATFQLTTDSDAIWHSRDGARWQPAPSAR